MLDLAAGDARLRLAPDLGGGIAGLWVGDKPVLRPWNEKVTDGPFALASNVLVPFSNRIENGFAFQGEHHTIAPNLEGETFPIHGDGFQKPWHVVEKTWATARLRLKKGSIGPFRYEAEQQFKLHHGALHITLEITNRAEIALPYGGGFHPWFPRDADTRLQGNAPLYWPEDERHLPASQSSQKPPTDFDFSSLKPLPSRWINAGFSGWNGSAQIQQGDRAVSVALSSKTLSTAVIYSPSVDSHFFCFEPVSHPVNAHNLPGMPGLTVLRPGQSLILDMSLHWGAENDF